MKALLLLIPFFASAAFGATADAKGPADTPESVRAKQDVLWGHMEGAIRGIVHETDAVVGVAIVDLTDQREFYLNADAIYPTASTSRRTRGAVSSARAWLRREARRPLHGQRERWRRY